MNRSGQNGFDTVQTMSYPYRCAHYKKVLWRTNKLQITREIIAIPKSLPLGMGLSISQHLPLFNELSPRPGNEVNSYRVCPNCWITGQ